MPYFPNFPIVRSLCDSMIKFVGGSDWTTIFRDFDAKARIEKRRTAYKTSGDAMQFNRAVAPEEMDGMKSLAEPIALLDEFARLRESAELIARHPDYPGKRDVEVTILREIDQLHDSGLLSDQQRLSLRRLLIRPIACH